jgi:hypothetical protein
MKFTWLTYRRAYWRGIALENWLCYCCNEHKLNEQMERTDLIVLRAVREGASSNS